VNKEMQEMVVPAALNADEGLVLEDLMNTGRKGDFEDSF